eukprot:1480077-Prymnesium_polylepis.1
MTSALCAPILQSLGRPGLCAATDDAEWSYSVQDQDFRSVTPSSEGLGLSDRMTTAAARFITWSLHDDTDVGSRERPERESQRVWVLVSERP